MAHDGKPILNELQKIRRISHSHGVGAHSRRQTITLSETNKKEMTMGYERYLGSFAADDNTLLPGIAQNFDLNELGLDTLSHTFENATRPTSGNVKKQLFFRSELHEIMHDLVDSKTFGGLILFIILLNTIVLVAQTWPEINVNAGDLA